MEVACIKIQKQHRLRSLKKAIQVLNYRKSIIQTNTFEQFTENIQASSVLSLVNYILTKIARITNFSEKNTITSQTFLSSFVIYGYSNNIIINEPIQSTSQYNINKLIIQASRDVVEMFDMLYTTKLDILIINRFKEVINLYKEVFNAWKIKDNIQLIHTLTRSYYEIDCMISEVQKEIEGKNEANETDNTVNAGCGSRSPTNIRM